MIMQAPLLLASLLALRARLLLGIGAGFDGTLTSEPLCCRLCLQIHQYAVRNACKS